MIMMRMMRRKRSEEENAHWFAPPSSQLDCQVVQVELQFQQGKISFNQILANYRSRGPRLLTVGYSGIYDLWPFLEFPPYLFYRTVVVYLDEANHLEYHIRHYQHHI